MSGIQHRQRDPICKFYTAEEDGFYGAGFLQVEQPPSKIGLVTDIKANFRRIFGNAVIRCLSLEDLEHMDIPPKTLAISLLELDKAFLPSMKPIEMDLLMRITDRAGEFISLNGATYLDGSSTDLTFANDLSRALMLEQPAPNFVILDVGNYQSAFWSDGTGVCRDIQRVISDDDIPDDQEYVSRACLLHISRLVPDHGLNRLFSQRQNQETCEITLEAASLARLAIKKVGIMDSIYFQQEQEATA